EMRHVEVGDGSQEVTQSAFCEMSGQVMQVRVSRKAFRMKRYHLLQPTGSERVVAQADLCRSPLALQAQFQGLNEANKQRAVQEAQVGQHAAPSDVARQRLLDFRNEDRLYR